MNKTRTMTTIAILSALSFVLMLFNFPLLPGADFLKIDFSIIPIMVGLLIFDLKSAYMILLLRSVLKLLFDNGGPGGMIGLPMNIMAFAVFLAAFALIWKKKQDRKSYILASLLGTVAMTLVMLLLNYVYAVPMYAAFAGFDIGQFIGIGKYLIAMVIPFNLLEGFIFAISFALVYLAIKPILRNY